MLRVLSIDGGGFLGLASVAFLEEMEAHFGATCSDRFEFFCGTSTGAIIAAALANGMKAAEVRGLYQAFGPKLFPSKTPLSRGYRYIRGFFTARYSNAPLAHALQGCFGETTLGQLRGRGKKLLVSAFSITNGKPRIFKTDHGPGLSTDDALLVSDVVLASAAAPIFLPLVELTDPKTGVASRYCDGGVFANHPALIAFAEALYHLRVAPKDVQLLSLSTPREDLGERGGVSGFLADLLLKRGLFSWRSKLAGTMIDGSSTIAHEILRRWVSLYVPPPTYVRVDLSRPSGTAIDVATAGAARALLQVGIAEARRADMRQSMSPFFQGA